MVEYFHAGDKVRASQFNRLVDAVCNLRRKIDSLKRGSVHPHLRVNQLARYTSGRSGDTDLEEPEGPQTDYCWRVRTVSFPVWRPPFSMHKKMRWVVTSTEMSDCVVCMISRDAVCGKWAYCGDGIIINPGSWFVGSDVKRFPCRVISAGNLVEGQYWLERETGNIVVGDMSYGPKVPGYYWPLGELARDQGCVWTVSKSWSGDIWEEPATWAMMGSRTDPVSAQLIFDFARMASGCVYETCRGYTCRHRCVFVPHNGQAKFVGLGMGTRFYYPVCGAMMLGNYTSRVAEVEWWTGEKPLAVTGSTIGEREELIEYQPKLCVKLGGRDCTRVKNCDGMIGPYRGTPVWVCHKRSVGYQFNTAEPIEFEVYGKVLGVAQIEEHTGDVATQIWPKPAFTSANTINSLWTTTNTRSVSSGGATADMQGAAGVNILRRLEFPLGDTNCSNWCLHQYIGHGYGIPKCTECAGS